MKKIIQSIEFVRIISEIIEVLKYTAHPKQIDFLVRLNDSFERGDFTKSIEDINGVELWGGAGAIWEIEMPDSTGRKKLDGSLISLLKQMKKENILGKRARSIYRMLVK